MANYFHITNGVIDIGPRPLPKAWRNISGLDLLPADKLKALGWLPQVVVGFEPFDPETQKRTGPINVINADDVTSTYTVTNKTAQEIDAEKDELAQIILNEPGLKAYALCINDGTIVPGANMTAAQLKAAVKAKL